MTADVRRRLLALLLLFLCAPLVGAQDQAGLRVGQWLRVKGELVAPGEFRADEIEVMEPDDEESLVGTPTDVTDSGSKFKLLGLPVETSARTDWHGIVSSELGRLQIKVQGHYRGTKRFTARDIEPRRSEGRDRIEARVDIIERISGGLELRMMNYRVLVAPGVPVDANAPLESYTLAPVSAAAMQERRNDDDRIVSSTPLSETVTFGGRLEFRQDRKRNFDLGRKTGDGKRARPDEWKNSVTLRTQLVWEPTPDFFALISGEMVRKNEYRSGGHAALHEWDGKLNQAFGYWRFPDLGMDLQVGRQDFDDDREWLYDQNLDGIRGILYRPGLRVELSASTAGADNPADAKNTNNFIAYVSNNDERKHLAAYVIDRRGDYDVLVDTGGGTTKKKKIGNDKPIFFGVRALGEWLPDQVVWAEAAVVRGYNDGGGSNTDYEGWGIDLGSTWSPESLDPVYITGGFALTSGDKDSTDETDDSFRQTGLQDNNGKFGGITSFRYYGEAFEPELSNIQIATVGVGARITNKTSIDLVVHKYNQSTAAPELSGTSNLRSVQPNGKSTDLGWGVDMILGSREWNSWETELTVGVFRPGSAFDETRDAWLAKLQIRYRF